MEKQNYTTTKPLNQNKMKQTAVEWLYKNLLDNPMSNEDIIYNINTFEKAKEIEKEQIKNAWLNSLTKGDYNSAEEYYNETFNKKL